MNERKLQQQLGYTWFMENFLKTYYRAQMLSPWIFSKQEESMVKTGFKSRLFMLDGGGTCL